MRNTKNGFAPEVIENKDGVQKYSLLNDPFNQEILNRIATDEEFRKKTEEAMIEAQFSPDSDPDEYIDFLWRDMERAGDVVDGNIVEKDTRNEIKRVK